MELLAQKKRSKFAFLWHGLENAGLSHTATLVLMFLAGSLLKMVNRTKKKKKTVNDRQKLKDFLLERVEMGS
jgi:hypothetical protein